MAHKSKHILPLALIIVCLLASGLADSEEANPKNSTKNKNEDVKGFFRENAEINWTLIMVSTKVQNVTGTEAQELINSDKGLLILIFYNSEEVTQQVLREWTATALYYKDSADVRFLDVTQENDFAKAQSVRQTPFVKLWNNGVPLTRFPENMTVHPRNLENVLSKVRVSLDNWEPIFKKNPKTFVRTMKDDPFFIVGVCETSSPVYSLIKSFASVKNSLHNVIHVNQTDKASLQLFKIPSTAIDQIFLVNKYQKEVIPVPATVQTGKQLFDFIMENKFKGKVVDLYSSNTEELLNEVDPFMVYVVPKRLETKLQEITKTLESVANSTLFTLKRIFIIKAQDPWCQKFIELARFERGKEYVAIIENGYHPPTANLFLANAQLITEYSIKSFLEEYNANRQSSKPLEQEPPKKKVINGIFYLTRKTLNGFTNDENNDALVFYYSSEESLKKYIGLIEEARNKTKKNTGTRWGVLDLSKNDIRRKFMLGGADELVLHPGGMPQDFRVLSAEKMTSVEVIIGFLKAKTTKEWIKPEKKTEKKDL